MALSTTTGNMTTKVVVKHQVNAQDDDGYPVITWTNVFSSFIWCYWIASAGTEIDQYDSIDARETATLTMRFTDKINLRDRVWLLGDAQDDAHAWEVITVNNGKMQRKFLEVKVRRVVPS